MAYQITERENNYRKAIKADLRMLKKHTKLTVEKMATGYGLVNKNVIKEVTELAIVELAREIAHDPKLTIQQRYWKIVDLYSHQVNLSHRTSRSMLLQQYSTPAPISFLAGIYVMGDTTPLSDSKRKSFLYFEPSAGNGLMTIAFPPHRVVVNEIDDIRRAHLTQQGFHQVRQEDASQPFILDYSKYIGVITNPPFGTLDEKVMYKEYPIRILDHLMALRALDTMRDNGRAAIIIGDHTNWDAKGRIQAGKNRIFFNYLYHHYRVDDVLQIDGHKLYARQGTAFNTRLILISSRKATPEHFAPLKSEDDKVIFTFEELWDRVTAFLPTIQGEETLDTDTIEKIAVSKAIEADPTEPQKGSERFSTVKHLDRSEIITDPEVFQGRQAEFAKETVDKIVSEGYDKSQDPIIVWRDKEKKKYVVISGHSRWRASEILYHKGDTSLKYMPVKVFIGDRDDATDYAIIESNRSGKSEGVKSDIAAYKRAATKGLNKKELLRYFKPESYLSLLKDLAELSTSGRFLEYLDTASEASFPYLRRNASWTGTLRRMYPTLTDTHEGEIFDFLYKSHSGLKSSKEVLFSLVEKKVMTLDFDPTRPLNLQNIASANAYSDPLKEIIRELTNEINALKRQREQKEDLIARAMNENMHDAIPRIKGQVSDLNKIILRKMEEKKSVEQKVGQVERQVTTDLFSTPAPPPRPEVDQGGDKKVKIAKAKAKARLRLIKLKRSSLGGVDSFSNNHTFNDKPFYMALVDIRGGKLLETYTKKKCDDSDYHHSFFVSDTFLPGIDQGKYVLIWMDELGFNSHRPIPLRIENRILEQIKPIKKTPYHESKREN